MVAVDESADDDLPEGPEPLVRSRAKPRRQRFRLPSLLLATFGWVVQLIAASLVAERSDYSALALLGTGALLLALALTTKGELPFAALGVGAVGGIATGLGALTAVSGWLVAREVVSIEAAAGPILGGVVTVSWVLLAFFAAGSSALSAGALRTVDVVGLVALVVVVVVTFPRIEGRTRETEGALRSGATETSIAPGTEGAPPRVDLGELAAMHRWGDRAMSNRPRREPSVASRPSEVLAARLDAQQERLATAASPSLDHRAHRSTSAQQLPLGLAGAWLVGLLLASVGGLGVRRNLARLLRLDAAVEARRVGNAFVVDDGRALSLDRESTGDEVLVIVDARPAGYRTDARAPASLVGTGSLDHEREVLRRRVATVALATVFTASASWLPLMIFRLGGWTITLPW